MGTFLDGVALLGLAVSAQYEYLEQGEEIPTIAIVWAMHCHHSSNVTQGNIFCAFED